MTCSQSVQSVSHVQLFATPWTAARQASLSITNCQSPSAITSSRADAGKTEVRDLFGEGCWGSLAPPHPKRLAEAIYEGRGQTEGSAICGPCMWAHSQEVWASLGGRWPGITCFPCTERHSTGPSGGTTRQEASHLILNKDEGISFPPLQFSPLT